LKVEHQTDDYKFDAFIEKLQEIVIEDEFENMQENFFTKYCNEFEEDEENKLIYMDIFKKYTKLTESYIEDVRIIRLKSFSFNDRILRSV
jgi:ADP-ribosylation factor 2-binding protein